MTEKFAGGQAGLGDALTGIGLRTFVRFTGVDFLTAFFVGVFFVGVFLELTFLAGTFLVATFFGTAFLGFALGFGLAVTVVLDVAIFFAGELGWAVAVAENDGVIKARGSEKERTTAKAVRFMRCCITYQTT